MGWNITRTQLYEVLIPPYISKHIIMKEILEKHQKVLLFVEWVVGYIPDEFSGDDSEDTNTAGVDRIVNSNRNMHKTTIE